MRRKGLPILVGILLIILNFMVHLFVPGTWFAESLVSRRARSGRSCRQARP